MLPDGLLNRSGEGVESQRKQTFSVRRLAVLILRMIGLSVSNFIFGSRVKE